MDLPDRYLGNPNGALATNAGQAIAGYGALSGDAQFDRLDTGSVFAIIRRRFWMLVRIVLLCLALAVLVTFNMPTHYMATSDVELHTIPLSSSNDQAAGQTLDDPGGVRIDAVDTELQVIKSRELAGKVFDRLNLGHDQGFMKDALTKSGITAILKHMVFIDPGFKTGSDDPRERRELAIDYMISQIDAIRIVTTAYAAHINYSDSDPIRAARIANGYSAAYASDQADSKQTDNSAAVTALKSRIQQLADQAKNDFAREQQYRIANNLLSTNATALTEQEVSTYNQQVSLARAEAAHDRAAYNTARQQLLSGAGGAGEVQAAPLITTLRAQRAVITSRLADQSSRYLDTYPEVAAARQQLKDIDAQIATEVNRTLQMLDARAKASEQKLASLEGSLGTAHGTLSHNNASMIALDDLHRRSQASQETYDTYLARYKATVAKSGAELPDARTISIARPPTSPSSPIWPLNLALGLVLGLMLGGTAAILAETNFSGLTTGDEVERRLGLRYFGGVPLLKSIKPRGASPLETIAEHPGGVFAESMRGVLVAARQSNNSRNQVLALTSALPGEGKTTLAACLATLAGMADQKVCLIDCDPVRANLSRLYPTPEHGLRAYLEDGFTDATVLPTDPSGFVSLITIRDSFSQGRRLNEQGRFHRLLAKLRERYDLIVLDLPPVLPIAETRELAALADNLVLVARWRSTSDKAVSAAIKMLPLRDISHFGLALNAVDMRKRMQVDGAETFYRKYRSYYSG